MSGWVGAVTSSKHDQLPLWFTVIKALLIYHDPAVLTQRVKPKAMTGPNEA